MINNSNKSAEALPKPTSSIRRRLSIPSSVVFSSPTTRNRGQSITSDRDDIRSKSIAYLSKICVCIIDPPKHTGKSSASPEEREAQILEAASGVQKLIAKRSEENEEHLLQTQYHIYYNLSYIITANHFIIPNQQKPDKIDKQPLREYLSTHVPIDLLDPNDFVSVICLIQTGVKGVLDFSGERISDNLQNLVKEYLSQYIYCDTDKPKLSKGVIAQFTTANEKKLLEIVTLIFSNKRLNTKEIREELASKFALQDQQRFLYNLWQVNSIVNNALDDFLNFKGRPLSSLLIEPIKTKLENLSKRIDDFISGIYIFDPFLVQELNNFLLGIFHGVVANEKEARSTEEAIVTKEYIFTKLREVFIGDLEVRYDILLSISRLIAAYALDKSQLQAVSPQYSDLYIPTLLPYLGSPLSPTTQLSPASKPSRPSDSSGSAHISMPPTISSMASTLFASTLATTAPSANTSSRGSTTAPSNAVALEETRKVIFHRHYDKLNATGSYSSSANITEAAQALTDEELQSKTCLGIKRS